MKRPEKNKLLPCPYCGGEGKFKESGYMPEFWVRCKKCFADTRICKTPDKAIKAWNTRIEKKPSVEKIAQLIASQDYKNPSKFKWEELTKEDKNEYYKDAQAIDRLNKGE